MMALIRSLLFLLAVCCIINSCSIGKNPVDPALAKPISIESLWEKMQRQHFEFTWFHIGADAQVGFEDMSFGGYADIRIKHDSAMLFSIRKFGFELFRFLIRPDSVFALSRLEGVYSVFPFDSLQQTYGLPFGYTELENLVTGNVLTEGQRPISREYLTAGYLLRTKGNKLTAEYRLNELLLVETGQYWDGEGRSAEFDLQDYSRHEDRIMIPMQRAYYYPDRTEATYELGLRLEKVEIDVPQKMRFEIPRSYVKI